MFPLFRNYTITERREWAEKRERLRRELQKELEETRGIESRAEVTA